MSVASIEHLGMCSNTVREIAAYRALLKEGFSIAKNPDGEVVITGPLSAVRHPAISDEFSATAYFVEHFGKDGVQVSIVEATDQKPEQFEAHLTGSAHGKFLAAEEAWEHHDAHQDVGRS